MAVINTGLLTKGLRSEFFARFEGTKTYFQDVATRIQSNSDSETYNSPLKNPAFHAADRLNMGT